VKSANPGSGWSARKHKCRFAENDIMVMHPDTNRGIEVLLNPIYNKAGLSRRITPGGCCITWTILAVVSSVLCFDAR
jgi:hypothetical protein